MILTAHESEQRDALREPLAQPDAAHAATDVGADDYQRLPMKLTDLLIVASLLFVCWAVVVGAGLTVWNVALAALSALGVRL